MYVSSTNEGGTSGSHASGQNAVENGYVLLSGTGTICSGATSALTEIVIQGKFCIIPRINPFDGITLKKLGISKNYKMIENSEELISFLKNFGNKKTKKSCRKNYIKRKY